MKIRNFLADKDVCIVAYAETKITVRSPKNIYELAAEAAQELYSKTDLSPSAIDGLALVQSHSEAPNSFYSSYMTDYLGITPRWLQTSDLGGVSATGNVARAAMAIRSGLCEVAMLIGSDTPSQVIRSDNGAYRNEFLLTEGMGGPPAAFGLLMTRYAAQYDLDYKGLGALAVALRMGAVNNPNALEKFRKHITIDDYLASRPVAEPLRLLDSVMFCDGANALLMTSTEKADRLGLEKRVYPFAYAEIVNFNGREQQPDITETGFTVVGPEALAKANISAEQVQQFHPYDDFLIAVAMQLEQIGFCARGRGTQFLAATDISPTGKLPLNTGGGQIGAGQVGLAGGGLNLVEAVRQLMGEAEGRQVPNPCNALVTGLGVIPYGRNWCSSSALVLVN